MFYSCNQETPGFPGVSQISYGLSKCLLYRGIWNRLIISMGRPLELQESLEYPLESSICRSDLPT